MMRSTFLLSALLVAGCHCFGDDCDRPGDRRSHPARGGHDFDRGDERCAELGRPDAAAADAPAVDAGPAPVDAPTAADATAGGCRLDRDCAAAGAGLVCEARSGACVAPAQCAADSGCAAGERCLAGRCLAPAAVCQFATDCGGGRDCVDGRCLAPCAAQSACPSTLVCAAGYCDQPSSAGTECARAADCAAGAVCADGRCVAGCDATRACPGAQVCVLGFCRVDTAPRSFCTRDAECNNGSVCRRGSCRAACPNGTIAECLRVDVAFDTCGSDLLCTNPLEQRPECARTADCAAPTICVNARCR